MVITFSEQVGHLILMSSRQQAQLELCNYVAEELFDEIKTDMECSADTVFQEMLLYF